MKICCCCFFVFVLFLFCFFLGGGGVRNRSFSNFFSVILSIIKYLHSLEYISNTLLKEAYCLSKASHNKGIQTWYTSYSSIIKCLYSLVKTN